VVPHPLVPMMRAGDNRVSRREKKKPSSPVFRDYARMTGNVAEAPPIPDPNEFKKPRPKRSAVSDIFTLIPKVEYLDPFGRRRRSTGATTTGEERNSVQSVPRTAKRGSASILQLPPSLYKAELTKQDSRAVVVNDDMSVESADFIDEEAEADFSETLSPIPLPPVVRDPSGRRKKDRFSVESLGKMTVATALEPVRNVDSQYGVEALARWTAEKGRLPADAAWTFAENACAAGITSAVALLEELQLVLDEDPETPYFALSDLVRARLQDLGCPRKLLPKLCVALQKFKEAPRTVEDSGSRLSGKRSSGKRSSGKGRQSEGWASSASSMSTASFASRPRGASAAATQSVPSSSISSVSSVSDPIQFKRNPPGPPRTVEMLAIITSLGDDLVVPRPRSKSSGARSTGRKSKETITTISKVVVNEEARAFSDRYLPAFKDVPSRKMVQPASPKSPVDLPSLSSPLSLPPPPSPSTAPVTPPPPASPGSADGVPPPPSYFPPTPSGIPNTSSTTQLSPALADIPAPPVFFGEGEDVLASSEGAARPAPAARVASDPFTAVPSQEGAPDRPVSAPAAEFVDSRSPPPPRRRESSSAKLRRDPSHREFIRDTAEQAQRIENARGERELKTTQQVKVLTKLLKKPSKGQSWSEAGMRVRICQPQIAGSESQFRTAHLHIFSGMDRSEASKRLSPRQRARKGATRSASCRDLRRNLDETKDVDDSMSDVSEASDVGFGCGSLPQELRWVESRKFFIGGREEGRFPLNNLLSVEEEDGRDANTFVLETADHRVLRIQMVDKSEAAKAFSRARKHLPQNDLPGKSSVLAKSASQQVNQTTAMLVAGFRALLLLQIEDDPLRQAIEARRRVVNMMRGRSWGIGRPLLERSWTVDAALAALAQVTSSLESKTAGQFDPLSSRAGILPRREQDAKLSQVSMQMKVAQNVQRRQGRAFSRLGGAKALLGILYRYAEHTDVVITGLRALALLVDAWPGTGVLPPELGRSESLQSEIVNDAVGAENPMYSKGRHRKGTKSWDTRQMCSFLEGAAQQLADYGAVECIMAILNVHGGNLQVLGAVADFCFKLVHNTEDALADFRKVGLPDMLRDACRVVPTGQEEIQQKLERCLSCFSNNRANVAVIMQTYAQPFKGSAMLKKSKQHHRHNHRRGQEERGGSGDSSS